MNGESVHEARYWRADTDPDTVRCGLCYKGCRVGPDRAGACGVRFNRGGGFHADNYGRISSIAMDPIEKKPLYHFHPGSAILSIGTVGCNLKCSFCQNHAISQDFPETRYVGPNELADLAVDQSRVVESCIGVAFTYSEPMVWFEYVMDAGKALRDRGLKVVLVTNGTIEDEPLEDLLKVTDAMNIDLKAFREEYYRSVCQGSLERVKRTIQRCAGRVHLELTTLAVTGLNDSVEEMSDLSEWVAGVDRNIPLHISRYFPRYRMEQPPTPEDTMVKLWDTAKRNLPHVFLGNVAAAGAQDTVCPSCHRVVVARLGMAPDLSGLAVDNGCIKCRWCGFGLPIVMDKSR